MEKSCSHVKISCEQMALKLSVFLCPLPLVLKKNGTVTPKYLFEKCSIIP